MTAEELLAHADVIRQYAEAMRDGNEVTLQFRIRSDAGKSAIWTDWAHWSDCSATPIFDVRYEWRLKPEPRHYWFVEYCDGTKSRPFHDRCRCEQMVGATMDAEIIEVVEVVP